MGCCFLNTMPELWYHFGSHHRPALLQNSVMRAMNSPWLAVCLVATVPFLWLAQAKSDEPGKVPVPAAVDSMLGKKLGQVRDDNGLKMKLVRGAPPGFVPMEQVEENTEVVTPVKVLGHAGASGFKKCTKSHRQNGSKLWQPNRVRIKNAPRTGMIFQPPGSVGRMP